MKHPLLQRLLYGLAGGLSAVGFQLAINWLYHRFYHVPSQGDFWHFAWLSFALISGGSLLSGWLLANFCPEAAGSGIPQTKLAFWKEFGYSPRRIAGVKFLAGAASIGAGLSLGREGPSVQLGSNVASTVAGWLGIAKQNRRAASAAGAAAGLAAAFNAPLAAVAFVLEEIIGDLNSTLIGGTIVASVVGAFVVHAIIGAQPAFALPHIDEPTWRAYLLMPIVAAFSAGFGIGFQWLCLGLRAKMRRKGIFSHIPKWLQPLGGGWATWAIGITVFATTGRLGVFSLGYEDLSDALAHGIAWKLAAILLIAKLAATVLSYGTGGCGGIFSPNLFFGAMCGALIAGIFGNALHLSSSDQILLCAGGMSACLVSVVQAPITAVLILFEMTHQFALLPGLLIAGAMSHVIVRATKRPSFYEEVLHQDGHQLERIIPPRDLSSWQRKPISSIARYNPVVVPAEQLADPGETLQELLSSHPYRYFPVAEAGKLKGILARAELEKALAEQRAPELMSAVVCLPHEIIRQIQNRFVEQSAGFLVLLDQPDGNILGIITLHDLLRAQTAVSEREGVESGIATKKPGRKPV